MTIEEAANKLGMTKETLRLWIINGTCPFGISVKKYSKNRFYINETRLNAWINGEDIKSATGSEGSALSD